MTKDEIISALESDCDLSIRVPIPVDADLEVLEAFHQAARKILVIVKETGGGEPVRCENARKRIRQVDWRLAVKGLFYDYDNNMKRPEDCGMVKDTISLQSKLDSHLSW